MSSITYHYVDLTSASWKKVDSQADIRNRHLAGAVLTNVSLSNKPFHFSAYPHRYLGMSNGVFTAAG